MPTLDTNQHQTTQEQSYWVVDARKDIPLRPHSPRLNININISNGTLILNRQKERQYKLIFTHVDI